MVPIVIKNLRRLAGMSDPILCGDSTNLALQMVAGGIHTNTPFYNTPNLTESSFEFFPPKDGGVPRHSPFLDRTLPANLFPRYFIPLFKFEAY